MSLPAKILFKKMHGSGNDFVLIDNRDGKISQKFFSNLAQKLCKRHFGIGADGLILIDHSSVADFKWHFFNADGSSAEMCGNGGRCAARFANLLGIGGKKLTFETLAGIIEAEIKEKNRVKLQLTEPKDILFDIKLKVNNKELLVHHVNTGVPHVVVICDDLEKIDVKELGSAIRFHEKFSPNGTNVNFIQKIGEDSLKVRTYERGVEDETYACGTGSVASAIIANKKGLVGTKVNIVTSGGEHLIVYIEKKPFRVYLEGTAILVYSGQTEEIVEEIPL